MELPNKDGIHHSSPHVLLLVHPTPGTKQLPAQQQRLSGVTERGEDALGARGFFEFVDEPLNTGKTDGSDLDKTSFFLSYKCSRDS